MGRPRVHPIKALTQSKKELDLSDEESDIESTEITGKKSKINNLSSIKKAKSQETLNNSSNVRQNNVDNNIQHSSNYALHKNWPFEPHKYDQNVKENAVASLAENHQQQSNIGCIHEIREKMEMKQKKNGKDNIINGS